MTESKHVEPMGACWRTRVQFPPPPPDTPTNQAPTGAFLFISHPISHPPKPYLRHVLPSLVRRLALPTQNQNRFIHHAGAFQFRVWDAGSNPGLGIEQGNQRHHISRLFPAHHQPISVSHTNESSAITGAVILGVILG